MEDFPRDILHGWFVHLILYTQFFVRHWLDLVEEPQVSQGSGQHCVSLGGVNILDDEEPLI